MIEPEVAFNNLKDNMDLTEDFLKYICSYILNNCSEDVKFLSERDAQEQAQKPQNERNEMTLLERLKFVMENPFKRLTYTEAIDVLMNSNHYKKKIFYCFSKPQPAAAPRLGSKRATVGVEHAVLASARMAWVRASMASKS